MTRQQLLGVVLWSCVFGLMSWLLLTSGIQDPMIWKQARAQGSERWREQVLLYGDLVKDGKRLDRADPWLTKLDDEAEEARRLNFERCQVAINQRLASGQIKRLRYDDPRTQFGLILDGARWREDPDISVLEEVACVFTAGDVRRGIRFPVLDERGQHIGSWHGIKFIGARHVR